MIFLQEKLTSLWTLTPRICELEHQQKVRAEEFWRLQEMSYEAFIIYIRNC